MSALVLYGWNRWNETRRFAGYEEVARLVRAGKLKANDSGDILLPKQWAWLTKNGHVYRTYDKEAGLALLFPTDVDKYGVDWPDGTTTTQWNIAGYVYCSGPLPHDGAFAFNGMNSVSTFSNRTPVRPHWYYVEPSYS